MRDSNQTPPTTPSTVNPRDRGASPASGPGGVSKATQKARPKADGEPTVKSATPKAETPPAEAASKAAARPSVIVPPAGVDVVKFWNDYFDKSKDDSAITLFQIVSNLIRAKNYVNAEAAIKSFLKPEHHGKEAEPWMYVILAECITARQGKDYEIKQTLGFAAYLAKKTQNPTDLIRVADVLVLRKFYGPVGDPGYETNIGELIDLAAEKMPANVYAPMMSVNLAIHDKDPKRMADAAERLLSLGWPGNDDLMRSDVKQQVKNLADSLRVDGRTEESDALMAQLAESEARDVYIKLTWKGEADIDIAVAEPLGATANYPNPRTVFGGAIVKNGYGKHPEEVYVCPRGFDGSYVVAVEKIVDYEEDKPVNEATLEVIVHEGTAEEVKTEHKIDLTKPSPVVVKLEKGRRKTVLPFVAPDRQIVVMKSKNKAKAISVPIAPPLIPPAPKAPPLR